MKFDIEKAEKKILAGLMDFQLATVNRIDYLFRSGCPEGRAKTQKRCRHKAGALRYPPAAACGPCRHPLADFQGRT